MTVSITLTPGSIASIEKLIADTKAAKDALKDRHEPLEKIRNWHRDRWANNILGEGSIYGGFAPLAPATVAKRGSSNPILFITGNLLNWVYDEADNGVVTIDELTWNFSWSGGRDGSVAVLHSEGYENTPARVVFETNGEDEDHDRTEMNNYINRIIAQYF